MESNVTDFRDKSQVSRIYFAEVEALLKRKLGCTHAFVYNSLTRTENPESFTQAYARFAHLDAPPPPPNDDGRVLRLQQYLMRRGVPEEEVLSAAIVTTNTWQPFDNPAWKNPLAVLDSATLDVKKDLLAYTYAGSGAGSMGDRNQAAYRKIQAGLMHNERHRWFFFPDMAENEVLVFKQLEGSAGSGTNKSRCSFHTSFDDPLAKQDAPGRRSIECRLVLTFPPGSRPEPGPIFVPTPANQRSKI
jgi:hypothetical protein